MKFLRVTKQLHNIPASERSSEIKSIGIAETIVTLEQMKQFSYLNIFETRGAIFKGQCTMTGDYVKV